MNTRSEMVRAYQIANEVKTFEITWTDGTVEQLIGIGFGEAFMEAGYGEVDIERVREMHEVSHYVHLKEEPTPENITP